MKDLQKKILNNLYNLSKLASIYDNKKFIIGNDYYDIMVPAVGNSYDAAQQNPLFKESLFTGVTALIIEDFWCCAFDADFINEAKKAKVDRYRFDKDTGNLYFSVFGQDKEYLVGAKIPSDLFTSLGINKIQPILNSYSIFKDSKDNSIEYYHEFFDSSWVEKIKNYEKLELYPENHDNLMIQGVANKLFPYAKKMDCFDIYWANKPNDALFKCMIVAQYYDSIKFILILNCVKIAV